MKTNLHQLLGVDPILSEEGVWSEICAGIRVKHASSESRRYKTALRTALQKQTDQRGTPGALSTTELTTALNEAMAFGLLLDWQGVTDEDNKDQPLAFSPEAALDLINDPELHIFVERIALAAQNLAKFRAEQIKAAEKN
jgi:hypothetical protein